MRLEIWPPPEPVSYSGDVVENVRAGAVPEPIPRQAGGERTAGRGAREGAPPALYLLVLRAINPPS